LLCKEVVGSPADDHIDSAVVQADLDNLVRQGEAVRVYAERTRAHRTKTKNLNNALTFRDLHAAMRTLKIGREVTIR